MDFFLPGPGIPKVTVHSTKDPYSEYKYKGSLQCPMTALQGAVYSRRT